MPRFRLYVVSKGTWTGEPHTFVATRQSAIAQAQAYAIHTRQRIALFTEPLRSYLGRLVVAFDQHGHREEVGGQ